MKKLNEVIKKCEIIEKTSVKTNNKYFAIDVEFVSGYKFSKFPSRELTELIRLHISTGLKLNEVIKSCSFVEEKSKKDVSYTAIKIVLNDGYDELVFLDKGENAILKLLRK